MKYIYYYIWLGIANMGYSISKPILKFRLLIRNTIFELKKIDDDELERRKKDINTNYYDFPDGISHWHAFAFTLAVFLAIFVIAPYIIFIDYISKYINTKLEIIFIVLIPTAFLWYWIYIKKSDKEWLKKKIDKKKKDFYL